MNSYNCCKSNTDELERINKLSSLLKLIGEESRLKILCLLKQGELCVCQIIDSLNMSQSLISHHLSDLKQAEIITDRKNGRQVFYSLTPKGQIIINKTFSL